MTYICHTVIRQTKIIMNHNKQTNPSHRETLLAMTGGDPGERPPVGFYTHNIRREEERIRELVEQLVSEACPVGMAKMLGQMISCVQVLDEETDVVVSELMDDVWRLANLNHLLGQLHSSKKRIGVYEQELEAWNREVHPAVVSQ